MSAKMGGPLRGRPQSDETITGITEVASGTAAANFRRELKCSSNIAGSILNTGEAGKSENAHQVDSKIMRNSALNSFANVPAFIKSKRYEDRSRAAVALHIA